MEFCGYKLKRKIKIPYEELFIWPQVTLNFNLLNTLKNIYFNTYVYQLLQLP